jgi:hypothetical protein
MNELALTPEASAAAATDAIRSEIRTIVVTGPDIQTLLSAVSLDIEIVPTMDIDSDDMAAELQTSLGRLATVSSAIEAERKERKKVLLDTAQWLDGGYNPAKEAVDRVIATGKRALIAWNAIKAEAARKAREEQQRKAQEEAARRAAEEAAALAAAQAAAQAAASAREAGSEQVAQAMETQAMAAVDTARQNAAQAAAALHVAPLMAPAAKVKGARQTWKGECINKAKLVEHIGAMVAKGDLSLLNLLEIDPRAVNAMAKLQEANLNVPGLRAYVEESVSVRKVAVEA